MKTDKSRRLRARDRERGQGMTEYILIVALVVIASIAVVTIFGDQLRSLWATSAKKISPDRSNATQNVDSEVKKSLDNGNF